MKILYVNVIECNAGWGAEYFVNNGLHKLGHTTYCIDYRKHRSELHCLFRELPQHDVFLLQRGDYFPIDLIASIRVPRFFWASELVSRCRDHDRLLSSGLFDHIFFHSKRCIETSVSHGWVKRDRCSVSLNGFDETVHRPYPNTRRNIDLLFAGAITPRRKNLIEKLQSKFKVTVARTYGKELVQLFQRSKIVLNIHAEDYNDTETRVFEALGCGAFLLTERLSEDNPFSCEHLVEFETFEELCDKINFYLNHANERDAIARRGYTEAVARHTYTHRADEIIQVMSAYLPNSSQQNENQITQEKRFSAQLQNNSKLGVIHNTSGNVPTNPDEFSRSVQDLAMHNDLKRRSRDLFNVAEQFAQNNQYNDAIQYYMMAIEADATLVSAYYSLAIVYYNTSQKDAAIMSFNKVIELEPENACAYNNLGVLCFSKGLLDVAEDYFKKAVSLDTNYKEAIQNLEKVHLKQNKFSVCLRNSPQQIQNNQLRINLIGALGNTWGAEYHVLNAFKELGHHVNIYDHRKGETTMAIKNGADISIVLKGEGIPPEVIKQLPKPAVLWYGELIHQDPSLADEVSKQKTQELTYNLNSFDIVFHHDYSALEMIKNLGAKNVFWLSNSGVNPKVHRKLHVPKLYDVGFTGRLAPRRIDMLNFLNQRGIKVKFLQVFGEELNLFINQCKIFINLHFTELLNTETRLHEILGAGTFALTEEISMPSMYIDNKHLVYWKLRDFKDLAEKILFYIQADEEREQIAGTGHLMVHENYKYTDRCKNLIAKVQTCLK